MSAIVPVRTTASAAVRARRGKAARWRVKEARAWVRGSIEEKLSQNPATGRKEEKRQQAAAIKRAQQAAALKGSSKLRLDKRKASSRGGAPGRPGRGAVRRYSKKQKAPIQSARLRT